MKYEVPADLMQRILDFIGTAKTDKPVAQIVSLVDAIRALTPVAPVQKEEAGNDSNGQ